MNLLRQVPSLTHALTSFSDDEVEAYSEISEIRSSETLQLKFDSIIAATDNFSEKYKLGQGGFGPVYKVMVTIL